MSDVFESDIDTLNGDDILSLEDNIDTVQTADTSGYVFPQPLYRLLLDYSKESLYATAPDGIVPAAGDSVIVPTGNGKKTFRHKTARCSAYRAQSGKRRFAKGARIKTKRNRSAAHF